MTDGVEIMLEQLEIRTADYDKPRCVSPLLRVYKTRP